DEAEGRRFRGAEAAAAEQKLESAMATNDARQMHEMDGWNETEIDFRIAEGGAFPGEQHVAGNGERHAAAAGRAGDGGNRWLAEIVLRLGEFDVELLQQGPHLGCRLAGQETQVQARAEPTRQRAREHDGANVLVSGGAPQRRYQLLEQG